MRFVLHGQQGAGYDRQYQHAATGAVSDWRAGGVSPLIFSSGGSRPPLAANAVYGRRDGAWAWKARGR